MNIKAIGCCLVSIEQMTSLFHKVLFMQKSTKLLFITLVPTLLMTNSYASEQSEVKGFIDDAEGSILFRTGLNTRDKKMLKQIKTLQVKVQS